MERIPTSGIRANVPTAGWTPTYRLSDLAGGGTRMTWIWR